ncbi:MAG: hypothetical protein KAS32_03365 [Candidatus Peribacteraceae bacterium]|nr:hypothetical protein [Candidatus Peribacteraceae bacterium]
MSDARLDTDKMVRPVTLKVFTEWVMSNLHRTWNMKTSERTLEVKYFFPSIDTRDMKVFHIRTNTERIFATHTELFDGNILELLEFKMDKFKAGEEFTVRDKHDHLRRKENKEDA